MANAVARTTLISKKMEQIASIKEILANHAPIKFIARATALRKEKWSMFAYTRSTAIALKASSVQIIWSVLKENVVVT